MQRTVLGFSVVFLAALSLRPQPPAASALGAGSVTGYVVCGDTRLPARTASVVLVPVFDPDSPALGPEGSNTKSEPTTTVTGAMLDGSFTISAVPPGDYYVVAEQVGYLSPLSLLSREDLNQPNDEVKKLVLSMLTPVTVTANHLSSVQVTLQRGAAISGTLRFDDGTPYADAQVTVLRQDGKGKWATYRTHLMAIHSFFDAADDLGRFRIVGLPPGDYKLKTTLDVHDTQTTHLFRANGAQGPKQGYTLDMYYGDTARERDAKPIHVEAGQQSDGNDIRVSLGKLHSVTGSLLDATTGKAVNGGKVEIRYPDDNGLVASTQVSGDDEAFHFLFVPEGSYTLKVTSAREVTRKEMSNCPDQGGCVPATYIKETKVMSYAEAQQPISIQGDMTGVSVTVNQRPATGTASTTTGQ